MIIVISICVIAVFFVQLEAKQKISFGYGLAFLLVTFLQAVHYDYGNDYMVYMSEFNFFTYKPFSYTYLIECIRYRDPLWPIVCYMFKPFGFFALVAFFAIIQNVIYFYFIKQFVPEKWLALGVFIYLFTPQLYLLNMSMLRQGFVEAIFILSFMIVQKKELYRYVIAICLMLIAGQIHSSANLFILFLFWPLIPIKKGEWLAIFLLILFVVSRLSSSFIENVIYFFLKMQVFERFEQYSDTQGGKIGLGYLIMSIPAIMILLFLKESQSEKEKQLVSMAVFERIMGAFSAVIMLAGRLSIFFSLFYMVAVPIVYSKIKDYSLKLGLSMIFIAITIYNYLSFFNDPTYFTYYEQFHTIFEVVLK